MVCIYFSSGSLGSPWLARLQIIAITIEYACDETCLIPKSWRAYLLKCGSSPKTSPITRWRNRPNLSFHTMETHRTNIYAVRKGIVA